MPDHLTVVDNNKYDENGELAPMRQEQAPVAPYDFEGATIAATSMKCSSASGLEIGDRRLKVDDLVEMTVVGRVTRVDHVMNEKSGHIERVHAVKVIQADYQRSYGPSGGVEFL